MELESLICLDQFFKLPEILSTYVAYNHQSSSLLPENLQKGRYKVATPNTILMTSYLLNIIQVVA